MGSPRTRAVQELTVHLPPSSSHHRDAVILASGPRLLPTMPQAVLWRYACVVAVISFLFVLYTHLPYYQGSQFAGARTVLEFLYVTYLAGALPFFLISLRTNPRGRYDLGSKTLLYLAISRQGLGRLRIGRARPRWRFANRRTKTALLSLMVKGFYLPVMTMFLCRHVTSLSQQLAWLHGAADLGRWCATHWYGLSLELLFFIDTAVFSFGYAVESARLKSRIKSVEPTLLGWAVTLLCYPPLNSIVSSDVVPWQLMRSTPWLAVPLLLAGLRILALACDAIFVWASLSLGFRASNLTNRGIVTWGPYRWVRHPAYTVKLVSFWCERLPYLTLGGALCLGFWHVIYFLRAWTEERHLLRDPDYRRYVQTVHHRFIPGVW